MDNFLIEDGARAFGSYDTRTFGQVFETAEDFLEAYKTNGIPAILSDDQVNLLFYLLYARYGYSHFSNYNETQALYGIFSTIWQYGPTWAKKIEIQKILRELPENELLRGSRTIYNHSYNPSTPPGSATLEELVTIDDQNTTNHKRSKVDGYALLLSLLEDDVSEIFLRKFEKYFRRILAPDYPLLFGSPELPEI